MRRKRGPSKIFSGRYVAQSLTRKRRRGPTGARISVERLRLAMLRIVRRRASQPLRRRASPASGGRRQGRSRATKSQPTVRDSCAGKTGFSYKSVRAGCRLRPSHRFSAGNSGRRSLHRQNLPYAVSIGAYPASSFSLSIKESRLSSLLAAKKLRVNSIGIFNATTKLASPLVRTENDGAVDQLALRADHT
jgi:hypothetical protein